MSIPSNLYLQAAFDALPQRIAVLTGTGVVAETNMRWDSATDTYAPFYAERGADYLAVCERAIHEGVCVSSLREDFQGREVSSAVRASDVSWALQRVLEGVSEQLTLEYTHFTDTGKRWGTAHVRRLDAALVGTAGGAVVSHTDTTEHKRHEQEMERVAYTDALTHLPNRRAFFERAKQMLALAKRHARTLHLMYIDLDGFKNVNDTFGHDVGDALLTEVAARFKGQARGSDLLARLGGDEFICLIEADHEHAAQISARYAACLNAPFDLAGKSVYVGASVGMAQFPYEGSTLRALLQRADTQMYERKRYTAAARKLRSACLTSIHLESWGDASP